MSQDGDQSTSSRQHSEGPSNRGDDDSNPGPVSFSTSYSEEPANATSSSSPSRSGRHSGASKNLHTLHTIHTSRLRYWASITPLICGGLGPTLTLMAISGCADRWRTENLPDGTVITEKDPKWVVAITAVAIVVGFFANIFLLMRMLGRANPKHMQYLSIALWALESIMNFTTIGIFVQIVGDGGDWTYAQGFWMTVCSACLSSICAFLLALNSFILPAFGKRGKMGLSGPQRVFVIQIMLFIFWLGIGAATFFGIDEFTFSESVYFVDVTVTTVGFGDNVVPKTNLARALVMPYAIVGIVFFGLVVTSIRTVVLERSRIRRALVGAIMKKQQKHLDHLKRQVRRRHASSLGVSLMVMGSHSKTIHDRSIEPHLRMIEREELKKRRLWSAEKWKEYSALLVSSFVFAVFWLAGAAIFSKLEGWSYFDGLYFCMIFFLTIGYGDFVVTTNAGRAVYIVYSLFTIPIITIFISLMSDAFLSKFQKAAERFGVKGGEDEQFLEGQNECQRKGPRWGYYSRKLFRRKAKKPHVEKDVEQNTDVSNLGDEVLRDEILDEVASIQESVNEGVDLTLGVDRRESKMPESEISNREGVGNGHVHRRRQRDDLENDDDERICEEDVDRAIQETRRRD